VIIDATSVNKLTRGMNTRTGRNIATSNDRRLSSDRQYLGNARPTTSRTPLNAASARNNAMHPVAIAVSFAIINVEVRQGSIRKRFTVRSSTSPANAIAVAATTKRMQNDEDVRSDSSHGIARSRVRIKILRHPKSNTSQSDR
jgi:hypothetical protein